MRTTLKKIRAHNPCRNGWGKLLRHLGKIVSDDEPLLIETILDANGIDDALWCLRAVDGQERDLRLYAVWCARRVQHLMLNPTSVSALDVAERYARGRATYQELGAWERVAQAAAAGAWAAARSAEAAAARSAEAAAAEAAWAWAAARSAAAAAAAARSAAGKKEKAAQAKELRRICREIEAGRDPYPEENGR